MNILFLKTIAMDPAASVYRSPCRNDFIWRESIMFAQCEKCAAEGTIGIDCHCGIYGSPNPEALKEYASHSTSFNVLLQAYGRVDVWTAPEDIWQCYVLRVQAAKVVGVVPVDDPEFPYTDFFIANDDRKTAALAATMRFDVDFYRWEIAKEMIHETWVEHLGIHPYDAVTMVPWRKPGWNWTNPIDAPWEKAKT